MDDFELDLAHLTQLRRECIDNLYLSAENVKKYLDNDKDDQINVLKICLQDYIVSEAIQENDTEALNSVTVSAYCQLLSTLFVNIFFT